MLWVEELFKTKKPIIAMLHLNALPGDPLFVPEKGMTDVVEYAKKDLLALQAGGVDGVIFSNEFSLSEDKTSSPQNQKVVLIALFL